MEETRCAVVTGGNKGIGFGICRQLALNGIQVVLTARNENRGVEAVETLNASGIPNVVFHQLDIKDATSIANLVTFIETRFKKLDILVNNAAEFGIIYVDDKKFKDGGAFVSIPLYISVNNHLFFHFVFPANLLQALCDGKAYAMGKECLDINYYGTKRVTETLVPLLQLSKSPRIVNVTSAYGEMRWFHNEQLKQEFLDIENLTEARIDEIVQWFLRDLKDAKLRENGWPLTVSAYKVSKAALNAYTRLMARKFQNNILVNAVHPGYVPTDMTSRTGIHTVEEAANTVVRVALLPDDGPSGVYFNKMEIAPFT